MEIILEEQDILQLLRSGLRSWGIELNRNVTMKLRQNNKQGTFKIVIIDEWWKDDDGGAPRPLRTPRPRDPSA